MGLSQFWAIVQEYNFGCPKSFERQSKTTELSDNAQEKELCSQRSFSNNSFQRANDVRNYKHRKIHFQKRIHSTLTDITLYR